MTLLVQNTREELADAKAENDAALMMLPLVVVGHIKTVCQSVREATTASGVDNATPPTGRHRWTGLFHLAEADHYCNWKDV